MAQNTNTDMKLIGRRMAVNVGWDDRRYKVGQVLFALQRTYVGPTDFRNVYGTSSIEIDDMPPGIVGRDQGLGRLGNHLGTVNNVSYACLGRVQIVEIKRNRDGDVVCHVRSVDDSPAEYMAAAETAREDYEAFLLDRYTQAG